MLDSRIKAHVYPEFIHVDSVTGELAFQRRFTMVLIMVPVWYCFPADIKILGLAVRLYNVFMTVLIIVALILLFLVRGFGRYNRICHVLIIYSQCETNSFRTLNMSHWHNR